MRSASSGARVLTTLLYALKRREPEARHRDAVPRRRQRRRARGRTIVTRRTRSSATHEDPFVSRDLASTRDRHDDIKTIGVIGAGTMGNGIAQVFAQSGFAVRLVDVAQPMLDRARGSHREEPRQVRREGQADRRPIATPRSAGCRPATTLDDLADADYVVEAIVENADAKRALFAQPRRDRAARRDPRLEHLVDLDHRCSARRRSGPTRCSACTS